MDFYFEDFISQAKANNHNIIIHVPLGCDKRNIYNIILKHSEIISRNHYMVSTSKSDEDESNDNFILYEDLNKVFEKVENKIFFIDNIKIFTFYGSSLLKDNSSNIFIFFMDIINILQNVFEVLKDYATNFIHLYPKQFCTDINIDYSAKKTIISKDQYLEYQKRFLEYKSLYEIEKIEINTPVKLNGILNVFLNKAIPNLSSVSVEYALQRAPKFKTIIVDLLLKNKNRHIVKMIDGDEGINSFVSIYDKLDNTIRLVIIRSSEPFSEKIKKIKTINSNNSPLVIITDFDLTGHLTPSNISYYHIADGGDRNDLITIFELLKSKNFSGLYSKDLFVVNHIAESPKGDLTINNLNAENFYSILSSALNSNKKIQKDAYNLFIKDKEMFVMNLEFQK